LAKNLHIAGTTENLSREILEVAETTGWTPVPIVEFCNPGHSHWEMISVADITEISTTPVFLTALIPSKRRVNPAIKYSEARSALWRELVDLGFKNWVSLFHPTAAVSRSSQLGPSSYVGPNASISSDTQIGKCARIGRTSSIGHDVRMGDFCTVGPGATVPGRVHIDDRASIGPHAVVLDGIRIGAGAFVGAGSVVTKDVPPGTLVLGNPARVKTL
jgi:sugar O-acyltransferase (sialic acid O-acetyltransferase NeuD family)